MLHNVGIKLPAQNIFICPVTFKAETTKDVKIIVLFRANGLYIIEISYYAWE